MQRRNLVLRTRTSVSQIIATAMGPVKLEFCKQLMTVYKNFIKNFKFAVNMDEPSAYF